MTLGPTAFAAVVWGGVAAVLAVFAYEVYALAVEVGWLDRPAGGGGPDA